jgi:ketosteroid isomerase-like protein
MAKESTMTISEVARNFVEKINAHDTEGLLSLMTLDHVFIDSLGNKVERPAIESGWREYFRMVPDYWVVIDQLVSLGGSVLVLFGKAGGTYTPERGQMRSENKWETPAAWRAVVRGGQVSEWRIYSDNEPIRERMRMTSHGPDPNP